MKKLLTVSFLVLLLSIAFTACSSQNVAEQPSEKQSQEEVAAPDSQESTTAEIPQFSLAIEGVEGVTAFTNEDAAKLTVTELDSSVTNKNGETTESVYTGVLLKDLLASVGVSELETLTIEASDGYQVKYDSQMAFADDVIVAWLKNGETMENGEIRVSPAQASGKTLAKMAVKLIVE